MRKPLTTDPEIGHALALAAEPSTSLRRIVHCCEVIREHLQQGVMRSGLAMDADPEAAVLRLFRLWQRTHPDGDQSQATRDWLEGGQKKLERLLMAAGELEVLNDSDSTDSDLGALTVVQQSEDVMPFFNGVPYSKGMKRYQQHRASALK